MEFLGRITDTLNDGVARTPIGYYFHLEGSGHAKEISRSNFTTELRAGLTTFFAMAYIIAVNAAIVAESGGTCVCTSTTDPTCAVDEDYALCKLDIQRDLVIATAAISALSSFMMGCFANLPVAVAPGMGINAYFTYQIVGYHGTGPIAYRTALTAVFVEGLLFVALSILGLRQWLARIVPASMKVACGAGIGLFLTLIGLAGSGIGAVTGDRNTPLALGGCSVADQNEFTGACMSNRASSPTMWIGFLVGGVVTALLMTYKVRGAMIFGIILVSIFSWPRDTAFTYFPRSPIGDARFDFFRQVVTFRPIQDTLVAQNWDLSEVGGEFALAIFLMLYVDILDCTGGLYSMAWFSGVVDPATGDFPRSTIAYSVDAIGISIGSLFGTSPVTAFIESGAGIQEGGLTGLTAMTTGLCFFISVFFAPIFASIPPWATGGTLVLVGCMMLRGALNINWRYPGDAIPAFVTLVAIPFTYSIAYGLIAGAVTYTAINLLVWLLKVGTRGYIVPPEYEEKEIWSLRGQQGASSRPWFIRAMKGDRKFWKEPPVESDMHTGRGSRGSAEEVMEGPNKEV